VQRQSGLIISGGKHKCFLREATLIKVENVSWKQIMGNNIPVLIGTLKSCIVQAHRVQAFVVKETMTILIIIYFIMTIFKTLSTVIE
jgi:hypothetical protein